MKTLSVLLLASAFGAEQLFGQTLANYQAEITSQSPLAYFTLDGTLNSTVGGYSLFSSGAGGFTYDLFHNPGYSYFFVDNTDFIGTATPLINGGGTTNLSASGVGSISFLFRTLPGINTGQRFLYSAGDTTVDGNGFSCFIENTNEANGDPNSLKVRFGNVTTTVLYATNILPNAWYYFALTYNETRTNQYWYVGQIGGALQSGELFNSEEAVAGQGGGIGIGNKLALDGGFRNPGSGRIDEFAIWNRELSASEVSNQFSKTPQYPAGASYESVVSSQWPKYFFMLNNSLVDSVGHTVTLTANTLTSGFTNDYFGNPLSAYYLTETNDALYTATDLISGGGPGQDGAATGTGTISFMFRMLEAATNGGQRYLFAQPGGPTSSTLRNQLGLFLENPTGVNPNSLKLRAGGATFGNSSSSNPSNNVPIAYAEELIPNAWYYFAMVYNEASNNGEITIFFGPAGGSLKTMIYDMGNTDVMGDNGPVYIGNRDTFTSAFRDPGDGLIDDFATWDLELSTVEIQAQFNALVLPAEPPTLIAVRSGSNVILSWPTTGTSGFNLESTTSLHPASWNPAGSPTVVGNMNYVTNPISGVQQLYRLKK